jgi:anti-sigma factor RsiW
MSDGDWKDPGCAEARRLIGLRHDNELDAFESIRVERHLAACESCRNQARSIDLLGSALRDRSLVFDLPEGFAPRAPVSSRGRGARLALPIAASLLAGSLLTLGGLRLVSRTGVSEQSVARDVVAAQIRANLPGHLTDVVSSDRHTVKPWFSGKIDYSPPVFDLSDSGFPLEGGRLDYVGGRTVAALVYRRRQHILGVYVWPAAGSSEPASSTENGFHVLAWTAGGMAFWAVSDIDPTELARLAALIRERTR